MDETELKHVLEAALLAAGRPLSIDQLAGLFGKRANVDRALVKQGLERLTEEYSGRGIELKEVASGWRIQIRRTMTDWLTPLWEERAPRYTRALLETLALIAYRQPVTRGEIEEIRGVVVSPNIIRTLMERNWVRVVGHRDVPGKPEMFGTTKDFLDYFSLRRLEDLPPLSEIKDLADLNSGLEFPETHPQGEFIDVMAMEALVLAVPSDGEAGFDSPADEVILEVALESEAVVADTGDVTYPGGDSSAEPDGSAMPGAGGTFDAPIGWDAADEPGQQSADSSSHEASEAEENDLNVPLPHAAGPR